MALRPFNVIELCAGAGGLGLGIELAVPGARGVAYVEREAFAAATLVGRMEAGDLAPAPVWSDLATFDGRPWRGRVHCVASGDPCQGNSVAGKQLGADDPRFLIGPVLRIVDQVRPLRFFRENVRGNVDGQLEALVGPLEGMGYRVECGIFSSGETGASHRRDRFFLMADLQGGEGWLHARSGRSGQASADSGRPCGKLVDAIGTRWTEAGAGPSFNAGPEPEPGSGELADTSCAGRSEITGSSSCDEETDGRAGRLGSQPDGHHVTHRFREGLAHPSSARLSGHELGGACPDKRDRPEAHGSASKLRRAWLPLGAPGPSDPRWPAILAAAPELEPALCRVDHAVAPFLDEVINEAEQRAKSCSKAYLDAWRDVQRVWVERVVASASRGLFEASGGQASLFDVPQSAPPSVAAFHVLDMRIAVQSREVAALYAMWRSEVLERAFEIISNEEMGWSRDGSNLFVVRNDVRTCQGEADDVFAKLRQQVRVGTQARRVDQLRLLGNGVDPVAAAYAWLCLDARHRAHRPAAAGPVAVRAAA